MEAETHEFGADGARASILEVQVRPQTTQEQRSEVLRKLGRVLPRLQQYELLTKDILVSHEASGTMSNWQERRQARLGCLLRNRLGNWSK
ncbi:hypothetical protein QTH91_01140 [Variovorax dokdonensis]|uniref:Uncharacterized protein n=1 Tax=Variovorax dokdonensis TaxID=344883 RepID=A0ABT7N574_9BURK|nr:hypothetical protein [Variovorax dokdonensis]MDM0043075.1 hypothetical protein [Variovorax dokdonensis]